VHLLSYRQRDIRPRTARMTSIVLLDDDDQFQPHIDTTVHNLTTNDDDDDGATSSSANINTSAQNNSRKEKELKGLKDLSNLLSQLDTSMADEKKHDDNLAKKLARTKKAKPAPLPNGVNKGVGYGMCACVCGCMHAPMCDCVRIHAHGGWDICCMDAFLCFCACVDTHMRLLN
jgi:hypothetical protein